MLRDGSFQHSYGSGLTNRGRDKPSESTFPQDRLPSSRYQGDIDEADIVALVSRSTSLKQVEPLTLFHLRDALLVGFTSSSCIKFGHL